MTVRDEALRAELLRRVGKDQAARRARDVEGTRAADAENLPPHLNCPGCGGRVPWEMPDDLSQPLTVACPACGRGTTIRFSR